MFLLNAVSWIQIIQHLTCERPRYHVSVEKMQRGRKGCFHRKKATLKVRGEAGWQKHWVWREATILLRHPPLSCDKNATLLGRRDRHEESRKENSGPVGVFAPAGTPARLVFSHRSTTNLATHPTSHHSAVQLLPRETSFKLRPDRPLQPVPHAVPCGSWG